MIQLQNVLPTGFLSWEPSVILSLALTLVTFLAGSLTAFCLHYIKHYYTLANMYTFCTLSRLHSGAIRDALFKSQFLGRFVTDTHCVSLMSASLSQQDRDFKCAKQMQQRGVVCWSEQRVWWNRTSFNPTLTAFPLYIHLTLSVRSSRTRQERSCSVHSEGTWNLVRSANNYCGKRNGPTCNAALPQDAYTCTQDESLVLHKHAEHHQGGYYSLVPGSWHFQGSSPLHIPYWCLLRESYVTALHEIAWISVIASRLVVGSQYGNMATILRSATLKPEARFLFCTPTTSERCVQRYIFSPISSQELSPAGLFM